MSSQVSFYLFKTNCEQKTLDIFVPKPKQMPTQKDVECFKICLKATVAEGV